MHNADITMRGLVLEHLSFDRFLAADDLELIQSFEFGQNSQFRCNDKHQKAPHQKISTFPTRIASSLLPIMADDAPEIQENADGIATCQLHCLEYCGKCCMNLREFNDIVREENREARRNKEKGAKEGENAKSGGGGSSGSKGQEREKENEKGNEKE